MSPTVEVRAIDALEDLQTALIRYAEQAQAMLAAVARETQRVLDWLVERQRHWRNEVLRMQEEERRAAAAYSRCLNSGDRDHPPSCGYEEQALYAARRRLAQAQAEERTATQARQAVQAEADAYAHEANRLRATLQTETVKSVEVLRSKVTVLRSYASGGVSASGVLAGALAFGAGLAIGAAAGRTEPEDRAATSGSAPDKPGVTGPGVELTLQELHPDIREIPLSMIDLGDALPADEADFKKVSKAEMIAGFAKLAQVRRWISQGATDSWLYDVDQAARAGGTPEAQSHHNIYRVFYGPDAISLERVGNRYRVINGQHRLAIAKELGWTTIPARVVAP